jgi:Pentapeptide repeats (9 copies)
VAGAQELRQRRTEIRAGQAVQVQQWQHLGHPRRLACPLEGANLSGGDILFDHAEFSGGEVVFDEAEFSDGTMSFEHAKFSGGTVSFEHAKGSQTNKALA